MQELRAFQVAHVFQRIDQPQYVVAVHRPDVVKAQLFKQRARHHHAFDMFFGTLEQLFNRRHAGEDFFTAFTQRGVELSGEQLRQMVVQRADVLGNRHFVVVQHHQHIRLDITCVVHRFKRHPGGNGAIANHADGTTLFVLSACRDRDANTGGNGGGRVADAQHVVFALTAPWERMQAAFLADGANLVATAGQNFVRVGLMADVPDKLVERRVIDVVQRHGELHRAKPGGEVSAGTAHAVEQVTTQLVAQLRQALFWQQTQFLSGIDQRQGRVFGNIKTHLRLIYCLFVAQDDVVR